MTSFWDNVDMNAKVDPSSAAAALGNLLNAHATSASDISTLPNPTTPTPDTTPSTTAASTDPVPTDTPVSQPYGGGTGHPGIDLAVPDGTKIVAAVGGKVTHAANDDPGGYGQWVEVTASDGTVFRYGHLSGLDVSPGDTVKPGELLGASGGRVGEVGAGNASGAHLHFEVRQNGSTVDPTPYLAGAGHVVASDKGGDLTPLAPEMTAEAASARATAMILGEPTTDTSKPTDQTKGGGDFFAGVLSGIGAPDTPENRRALQAWQQAEGGSADNPWNTTQDAPGATEINSVGVKRYGDVQTGITATIQTLLNGRYANIISALKSGNNAMAVADAIEQSPWGTGGLVKKVLNG